VDSSPPIGRLTVTTASDPRFVRRALRQLGVTPESFASWPRSLASESSQRCAEEDVRRLMPDAGQSRPLDRTQGNLSKTSPADRQRLRQPQTPSRRTFELEGETDDRRLSRPIADDDSSTRPRGSSVDRSSTRPRYRTYVCTCSAHGVSDCSGHLDGMNGKKLTWTCWTGEKNQQLPWFRPIWATERSVSQAISGRGAPIGIGRTVPVRRFGGA
jgi:hypothetical protein